MTQQALNEWKRDGVTCGSHFPREGFSAWLGEKVKAEMEGHVLPSLNCLGIYVFKIFNTVQSVSSLRFLWVPPPTERLEHSVENEPWKQQDMWMEVFHKIFYTLMHLIRHLIH